jgi:hypothetical protein
VFSWFIISYLGPFALRLVHIVPFAQRLSATVPKLILIREPINVIALQIICRYNAVFITHGTVRFLNYLSLRHLTPSPAIVQRLRPGTVFHLFKRLRR